MPALIFKCVYNHGEYGAPLQRSSCGCFVTWAASVVDSVELETSVLSGPASPACSCLDSPFKRLQAAFERLFNGGKHRLNSRL